MKHDTMKIYIAVGIGGIIGSVLRYLISLLFWTEHINSFPWATYFVNISGACLLTFIVFHPFFVQTLSPQVFVGLTTGLIGSYTTFSTLILEITTLWNNDILLALFYTFATIFGGLFASYSGYFIAQRTSKGEV